MLNRSLNWLKVIAPIPMVHAWPPYHMHGYPRALPLSSFLFFLFFFLVHFLYVRIRSIRSTRRAYNADRKLWRRAKLLPLSLSFSFRMCSMLPFQPSGGIVSSILETLWQNHEQFCQNKSEKEGYNTRFLFTYMLSHSNLLKLIEMTD